MFELVVRTHAHVVFVIESKNRRVRESCVTAKTSIARFLFCLILFLVFTCQCVNVCLKETIPNELDNQGYIDYYFLEALKRKRDLEE
jgi:hypothetical protein